MTRMSSRILRVSYSMLDTANWPTGDQFGKALRTSTKKAIRRNIWDGSLFDQLLQLIHSTFTFYR